MTIDNTTIAQQDYPPGTDVYFKTDVWTAKIDSGEADDLLIASSDGTDNLQPVTFYFPHPAGEALNVTISSTDDSQDLLWDTPSPDPLADTPVLGPDSPTYTFQTDPTQTYATFWTGAKDGSTTFDVLKYEKSGTTDTADSTDDYNEAEETGGPEAPGTVPSKAVVSNPASLFSVKIVETTNPNGGFYPNGVVSGVTRNWLVGQAVGLTAVATEPITLFSGLHYSWHVPGNVLFDYSDNSDSAHKTNLAPENDMLNGTSMRKVWFFWVHTDGEIGSPDDDNVSVEVTGLSTTFHLVQVSATTSFNVYEPDSSMSAENGPVQVYPKGRAFYAGPIQGGVTFRDGFVATASVSVPAVLEEAAGQGAWKFVQLVKESNYTAVTVDGTGNIHHQSRYVPPTLDNADPYPFADDGTAPSEFETGTEHSMLDLPSGRLYLPVPLSFATYLQRSAHFETYVMFRPPGLQTKWVPLESMDWGFALTAKLDAGGLAAALLLGRVPYPLRSSWSLEGVVNPSPAGPYYQNYEPDWNSNGKNVPLTDEVVGHLG